jgi:triacylglycerol esterase/lipase EstA (alpha/beta hydrolase family)
MKKTNLIILACLILVIILILVLIIWKAKTPVAPANNPQNNNNHNQNISQDNMSQVFQSEYPVILVHGWMGKAVDFAPYGQKLQEDGIAEYKGTLTIYDNQSICPEQWPRAVSVSAEYYYDFNKDNGIENYSSELEPIISLVKNCTGSDEVIILAHSMGGLVSREYMVEYGNSSVKKLITLATPHYGYNQFTRLEVVFMMINVFTSRAYEIEQMKPGSDFLKELDKDDINYRSQIVSIGTYNMANATNKTIIFGLRVVPSQISDFEKQHFDNTDIVVSLDSTKLAGAKYYQVEGCSHTEILDFRASYPNGPINNPNTCQEAYGIVKNEILDSS